VCHQGGFFFVLGYIFLTWWRRSGSAALRDPLAHGAQPVARDERTLVDLWEAARRMEARIENLDRAVGAVAPPSARWRGTPASPR